MFEPAPTSVEKIFTPAWLTEALGVVAPERIVDVRSVDDYTTVLSKIRFEVDVVRGDGTRETRRYCLKGGFTERAAVADIRIESRFLREVGPSLDVRMPVCRYGGIDETTGRCVFIMDDLVAEGVQWLNSQFRYTPELAAQALTQLAILHASTWGADKLRDFEWLIGTGPSVAFMPLERLQSNMDDGRSDALPSELRDAARIASAVGRVAPPSEHVCVVHGDPHSLNIYLDREGRPCLLDWQLAHVGHWAIDVAYHIAVVLDIETRRAHERELLQGYLADLRRLGVDAPSFEDAWADMGRYLIYGFFLWNVASATPRVDIIEHVPRLGTAMLDHATLEKLGF
ncbi:MAG: phosphotransferase family protein [Acidimicrobiia bacterium]